MNSRAITSTESPDSLTIDSITPSHEASTHPSINGENLLHRRDFWLLCLATFVAVILSKAGALLPGMSIDDYSFVFGNATGNTTYNLVAQGRGLNALLFLALGYLNTSFTSINEFSFVLASAMISLAIAGSITLIKHEKINRPYHYASAALAATHPYLTSYFLFRMSLVNHACVYATLFASLCLIAGRKTLLRQLTCIVLLVACSHISQIILILFSISAGAWSLARYCRERKSGAPPLDAVQGIISLVVILVAATALYFLSSALIRSIMHVNATPIYSIHVNGNILNSIQVIIKLACDALLFNETIIPYALKLFLLTVMAVSIALCFAKDLRQGISCLVLLTCGTVATVSTMALSWGYLVPRTFSPIGLCLALTYCLACNHIKPNTARILSIALIIPTISFCFIGSSLFYQQMLLTQWDQRTAVAIYNRFTQQVPEDTPIYIVASWPIHKQPLSYNAPGINESAFLDKWAYPGLFATATGEKLNVKGGDRSMCNGIPAWPDPSSMKRLANGSTLVCMTK